jgi:hypothetical protein
MVDTCCDGQEMSPEPDEILEYKECFRATDGRVVLYSTTGMSPDFGSLYPASFSKYPWTSQTTLYFGYHDGLLRREDEPAPVSGTGGFPPDALRKPTAH